MFTGIIEEVGTVARVGGGQIVIDAGTVLQGTKLGDSIAVNGVCLTVAQLGAHSFTADVMPETLRRSSLGALRVGSGVNLERALTPTSRMGGHIVSGHIDGVGTIAAITAEGNARVLAIDAMPALLRYIAEKGSVALDGVSLTVAGVTARGFTVSLIPHTRQETTLTARAVGERLNIETDILAKYVEKLLHPQVDADGNAGDAQRSTLTRAFLTAHGF